MELSGENTLKMYVFYKKMKIRVDIIENVWYYMVVVINLTFS